MLMDCLQSCLFSVISCGIMSFHCLLRASLLLFVIWFICYCFCLFMFLVGVSFVVFRLILFVCFCVVFVVVCLVVFCRGGGVFVF